MGSVADFQTGIRADEVRIKTESGAECTQLSVSFISQYEHEAECVSARVEKG